jgi:FlaA1/EpsC-like NDP-sugar epimerase
MQIKKLIERFLIPTHLKRVLFFLLTDTFFIVFSFYFSFYLRFGFEYPLKYHPHFKYWIGGILVIKLVTLALFSIYKINWRFVGITELGNLLKSAAVSTVALYGVNLLLRSQAPAYSLPRGVIIIDAIISFGLMGLLKISKRLIIDFASRSSIGKSTLIIGADLTSERLIKELKASVSNKLIPIAFIDENPMRIGTRISGIPVAGGYDKIGEIINVEKVDSVLINLPRASHKKITQLFNQIIRAGVDDIKIVPHVDEFNQDVNVVKDIKNLDIDDLLSRESVRVNYEDIGNFLREKTILVSGAAGSIGSEIARKLVQFGVKHIVGYEIDETEVFNLQFELGRLKNDQQVIDLVVGDVRDRGKLEQVFEKYKPDIVFHASAYKHVPLMEAHPEEAIKTNVFGTRNMADTAVKFGVKKFITISTDKAVNPTSVMGATKRFSEMICKSRNCETTRFTSVRFGNVLGSRGSVIPLFLQQIKEGGPVTVTHPDIKRYFMSIPEAVLLVFQAAYMGSDDGGEVFVLDMGEPVKIVQLAENLVRLNNMEPYKDIDIVYTGLRPGEKLFEELLTAEEGTDATNHSKIYIARKSSNLDRQSLNSVIAQLENILDDPTKIKNILKEHIPYYQETSNESNQESNQERNQEHEIKKN